MLTEWWVCADSHDHEMYIPEVGVAMIIYRTGYILDLACCEWDNRLGTIQPHEDGRGEGKEGRPIGYTYVTRGEEGRWGQGFRLEVVYLPSDLVTWTSLREGLPKDQVKKTT